MAVPEGPPLDGCWLPEAALLPGFDEALSGGDEEIIVLWL